MHPYSLAVIRGFSHCHCAASRAVPSGSDDRLLSLLQRLAPQDGATSVQDDLQQASSRCDALSEENARLKRQPSRERPPPSPAQSQSPARRSAIGQEAHPDPLNDQVCDSCRF